MEFKVEHIPPETKWAMSTRGLTGALAAHLDAMYDVFGQLKYTEMIHSIWSQIGKGSAEEIKASGIAVDNAKMVAEAGVTSCICAMGPEYKIEQIEASADRTVMKISKCPWKNRMVELAIPHDLLSAADNAFWNHFTKNLNPNVTMRHGKQMHKGDPYCEWIFETINRTSF